LKRGLMVLVALWLVACASPTPATGPVAIELDDFYIYPTAERIGSGDVQFEVSNDGEFPHTLVVAKSTGEVVYASDVLDPGATIEVDLDLVPDTYQLTCRIVVQLEDGTLVDHYQNGMGESIEVAP